MAHDRHPWLNLDAIVDTSITSDLAAIRAEAEALAPTVRDFAIRAFRATNAFEAALSRANLPDEVWEIVKHACGAGPVFEIIGQLVGELQVAWLEKPDNDTWPDWYAEESGKQPRSPFNSGGVDGPGFPEGAGA